MQKNLNQKLPFTLLALRKASPKTCKIVAEALEDDGAIGTFNDSQSALKALYAATEIFRR